MSPAPLTRGRPPPRPLLLVTDPLLVGRASSPPLRPAQPSSICLFLLDKSGVKKWLALSRLSHWLSAPIRQSTECASYRGSSPNPRSCSQPQVWCSGWTKVAPACGFAVVFSHSPPALVRSLFLFPQHHSYAATCVRLPSLKTSLMFSAQYIFSMVDNDGRLSYSRPSSSRLLLVSDRGGSDRLG